MRAACVTVLLLVIACSNAQDFQVAEEEFQPITISLYYESLCPDSVSFIENELFPTWLTLSRYFVVDWVPYGKAQHRQSGDSYTFTCQHGAQECRGNMIQACALDKLTALQSMHWIHCVMGSPKPQNAGPTCSSSLQINYDPIKTCIESNEGKQLLAAYGNRTHALRPRLTFVPTVTFDGVYNANNQQRALRDFRGVLCDLVNEKDPTQDCS